MKQISEVETITSSRPALSGWICWGAAAPFVMALLLSFQVGAMKPLSCTIQAGAFQDVPAGALSVAVLRRPVASDGRAHERTTTGCRRLLRSSSDQRGP